MVADAVLRILVRICTEHCRNSSQPLGDCHAREEAQEKDSAQTRRLQEEAEEAPRSRRQLKLGRSVGASVLVHWVTGRYDPGSRRSERWTVAPSSLAWEPCSPHRSALGPSRRPEIADPVASGFAVSISRPGRNMTGFTLPGPEVTGKRLGFLKEAVPKLSRVAVLLNPTGTIDVHHLPAAQKSARELGLHPQVFESRGPQDFDRVFTAIATARAQGVLLLPDTTFFIGREQLSKLAVQHRLALSAHLTEYARAGMLVTYGPVLSAEWRRAGRLLGRILNGTKPADIPIEAPSRYELVINLATAKALGLTIPPSLMLRADQVIE